MAQPAQRVGMRQATVPVVSAVGAVSLGLAAAASALAPLAAVGALIVGYLLLATPETALLFILLARPLLDLAPQGLRVWGFAQELDLSAGVALLLTGAGALYVLSNRIDPLRIPLVVPFAALLGVATSTLLVSAYPDLTLVSLVRLMSQLSVYILTFSVLRRHAQGDRLLAVLVAAAIPPLLWGFGQILTGHGTYLGPVLAGGIDHPRLGAPFGNGLTLGTYLLLPLVVITVLLLESHRRGEHLLYGSLLAFFMVAFYLTLARAPWVGFVLALGVLGIARYRVLLIVGPVALLIIVLVIPGIRERWEPVIQNPDQTTAAGRFDLWRGAWTTFREAPILGAGFGVSDVEAGLKARGTAARVHSDYLRVLTDTGLLGLMAYLWLLGAAAVEGLRTWRRVATPRYRALALSFLAIWAAFMVVRISGNVLTNQMFQYYFWALAALVLALPRLEASGKDSTADAA